MSDHSSACARDMAHAEAFRDLEGAIANLRSAACLMEIAAEDTVCRTESNMEKSVREKYDADGLYRLRLLTKGQEAGLEYAINHVVDMTRRLYVDYYARLEQT